MLIPSRSVRLAFCSVFLATAPWCHGSAEAHSGEDLQGKNFQDGNLNASQFDGANLKGANFSNATLKKANFRNANLQGVNFTKAQLDDADFTGANLKGADFADARAWRAKLPGTSVDLAGVNLIDVKALRLGFRDEERIMANQRNDCGSLSFHYADLHDSKIIGNAANVDFRGADLRGANLSEATNLDTASLAGAKYDANTLWKIDPVKMRAELVAGTDAAAPKPATQPGSPLVGKWLVMKGEKGATESGSIRINADGSYEWDYSASAPLIKGRWDAVGDDIVLKQGEKGQNWRSKRTAADEILLKSDGGDERDAVLDK